LGWRVQRDYVSRLLSDGWKLGVSGLLVVAFMRIDQFMLGELAGAKEVGVYAVAIRFVEPWSIICGVLLPSIYPKMIELKLASKERYYGAATKLFRLFFLLSVGAVILHLVFSDMVVAFLLGATYEKAAACMKILAVGLIFTFSGSIRAQLLLLEGGLLAHAKSALAGLAVLIPSNMLLIPRYGAEGAAWVLVGSYFVSAVLTSFLIPNLRSIGKMQLLGMLK
jgi:PST family polysaccharide transporter